MVGWLGLWWGLWGGAAGWAADASPEQVEGWLDSVVMLVTGPAWCSGVVVDDAGTVATAYHCVASGRRSQVRTRDGARHIGRTIAAFPDADLALLSVPGLAGAPARPVRAETPPRGERVYGIGHPYAPNALRGGTMEGMLWWSVSEGIISATGPWLLQTDAALNPGNSGGPTLDAQGNIVGIASRKLSGDNIAFLARGALLADLMDEPTPPRLIGGQWGLGSAVAALSVPGGDGASSYELLGHASVRDTLIATVGLGVPLNASERARQLGTARALALETSLAARLRAGRGVWSTTLDVGGGAYLLSSLYTDTLEDRTLVLRELAGPDDIWPGASARLGFGGVAYRHVLLFPPGGGTPAQMVCIDLDVPGVLGVF